MNSTIINGIHFVNLTEHVINVVNKDGRTFNFPPSGIVARMGINRELIDTGASGVDIYITEPDIIKGIDHLHMKGGEHYIFITSLAVRNELNDYLMDIIDNNYEDGPSPSVMVVSPGELIRNDKGQPIGCKGLDM